MTGGGLPPDEDFLLGQIERMKEMGNQAPPPKKGDKYIIGGALAGIVAGIIIALATGFMPWVLIAGIIGGGIAGAFLGSLVSAIIKRFQRPKGNLRYY